MNWNVLLKLNNRIEPEEATRRLLDALFGESAKRREQLAGMTNKELATILCEKIWAYLDLDNPLSDLLDEVIERLNPTLEEYTE